MVEQHLAPRLDRMGEHKDMKWGSVQLQTSADETEFFKLPIFTATPSKTKFKTI